MAKALTQATQTAISNKRIDVVITFTINGTDYKAYLLSYNTDEDRGFGSATATFVLNNNGGIFGQGGSDEIDVGDVVVFKEKFSGDSINYDRFEGKVYQRTILKEATQRTITLTCFDYIHDLKNMDINLLSEGTKVEVTEETLTPNYLASPNDSLAQIFNFNNDSIAQHPEPLLTIRPKTGTSTLTYDDPQYDGLEIQYANGQVVLGTPLNAKYNYDLVATSYFHYVQGKYIEDVIEEIITTEDGYSGFLFGETSAQNLIDNHLKTTYQSEIGTTVDYLTPNLTSTTISIKHRLAQDYDPDASGGDPSVLYLDDTEGLPEAGTGNIHGDIFTWTGIDSGNALTGISESGSNALKKHLAGSYMEFENSYPSGTVWYLKYSNITSVLDRSKFSGLPLNSTIAYIDYRNGRIILADAISTATIVAYNEDYTFKTLQTSGILIDRIRFHPREIANRFEAINKLLEYCPPNYVIRSKGNKIWASLLSQSTVADYTLNLVQSLSYLEDEDLYTRVVFYGKNINPTNLMFSESVDFITSTENYLATAVDSEFTYDKTEGNFKIYNTSITNAGHIDLNTLKPTIYINDVPIDDKAHQISAMPLLIEVSQKTETITEQHTKSTDVTTRQYWYYFIRFAHGSIDPTQPIYLYNSLGSNTMTISPNDGNMSYGSGIYRVPGDSQNSIVEQLSTASYTVFYSTSGVEIDYENIKLKISSQLIPSTDYATVKATFKYWTAMTPLSDSASLIDGRWNTQTQTIYYAEPPTGLNYAILDLGQIKTIQAIDIVGGFFRPDGIRKYDIDFRFSLQYSTDNINYYTISPETQNVQLTGGSSTSFEESDLGTSFQARYVKLILQDVKKIDFEDGVWVVSISEISAYSDVILKSEAKLIATNELSGSILVGANTINVLSTSGFTTPNSGETATAYVGTDAFTYTELTSTSFLGVVGIEANHSLGTRVSQQLEDDNNIYDNDYLLPKLGDRLYKEVKVSDDLLFTQTQLDVITKAYLEEFYKNHNKLQVNVLFSPYLYIGQTVSLTDSYNRVTSTNYFIESINNQNGIYSLVLAYYP